jgi:hypothetical protein
MAVHPDRVQPVRADDGAEIEARVVRVLPHGARVEIELEANGRWRGRFRCRLDQPVTIGDLMWFVAPEAPIFRTAEGGDLDR